jgi:hypothetical protein
MVRTLVTGWPGSTSRTAARTAAVMAAGSVRVRTTNTMVGAASASRSCGAVRYIVGPGSEPRAWRTVPTIPTTVYQGLAGSSRRRAFVARRNRLPSASPPGQKVRAMTSSTTATSGLPAVSPASSSRPQRSGMPMVSK